MNPFKLYIITNGSAYVAANVNVFYRTPPDEELLLWENISLNFPKLEKARPLKIILGNILCTWVTISSGLIYLVNKHHLLRSICDFTRITPHPRVCHIFPNPVICICLCYKYTSHCIFTCL